ncbi:MAG: ribosome maturation factor RimP [Vicinamibacterales bacterium]
MRGVASIVEQVRAAAGRIAESHGLEIFDVQFRREASGMVLRVQIDRPGPAATEEESVGVADCSKVSRDLSALLDVEDLIPGAYTLEVSSPGLDRPLRGRADYERFVGRCAKLVLREAVDGQTFFRGRLAGVEDDVVMLDGEGDRRHRVPLALVTRANLEVEF